MLPLFSGIGSAFGQSTTTFVFAALAFGILALVQYHIHRTDYFQKASLMVCLCAGFFIEVAMPTTAMEHDLPFSLHMVALAMTTGLMLSACGHRIWRMLSSTQASRLERKLQEWAKDAPNMSPETHVIKVCEVM